MNCLNKMTEKAESCCRMFGRYKRSCPLELTAKCNNHFGIRRRGEKSELAGINMHGSYSITLLELLLFSAITAFVITVSAAIGKIIFKLKYKKR